MREAILRSQPSPAASVAKPLVYSSQKCSMTDVAVISRQPPPPALMEALQNAGFVVTHLEPGDGFAERMNSLRLTAAVLDLSAGPDRADPTVYARRLPESAAVIAVVPRDALLALATAAGFDDFVVAPADPEELAARVRLALWRRSRGDTAALLRRGDLIIDAANYKVLLAGWPVELTYKEYELLRFLAAHEGKVFTREALLNRVWGYNYYGGARTVDVHVRRLRSKIEVGGRVFIETVRNVGYRFVLQHPPSAARSAGGK